MMRDSTDVRHHGNMLSGWAWWLQMMWGSGTVSCAWGMISNGIRNHGSMSTNVLCGFTLMWVAMVTHFLWGRGGSKWRVLPEPLCCMRHGFWYGHKNHGSMSADVMCGFTLTWVAMVTHSLWGRGGSGWCVFLVSLCRMRHGFLCALSRYHGNSYETRCRCTQLWSSHGNSLLVRAWCLQMLCTLETSWLTGHDGLTFHVAYIRVGGGQCMSTSTWCPLETWLPHAMGAHGQDSYTLNEHAYQKHLHR